MLALVDGLEEIVELAIVEFAVEALVFGWCQVEARDMVQSERKLGIVPALVYQGEDVVGSIKIDEDEEEALGVLADVSVGALWSSSAPTD